MFNIFRKKQPPSTPTENVPGAAGTILIVTATTNFGLVVSPTNKEPLMFTLDQSDSIATCIERNAPYITAAIDVASCLVIELAAHLPNQAQTATNKIFALILPDPGILLNHDMVLVGYEELERIPGPTSSMLQMLVKQVPKEYFAEPSSSLENKSNNVPLPAEPVIPAEAAVVPLVIAEQIVEPAGFDSAPVSIEQPVASEQVMQQTEEVESTTPVAEVQPLIETEPVEPAGFDSTLVQNAEPASVEEVSPTGLPNQ